MTVKPCRRRRYSGRLIGNGYGSQDKLAMMRELYDTEALLSMLDNPDSGQKTH